MISFGLLWGAASDEYMFGKRMFDDKLYDEAIQEFRMVINQYPTSPYAEKSLFYSGEAYRIKGLFEQAENNYRKLWEGYPNSVLKDQALYYLALSTSKQNKTEEAIVLYNTLFKLFPKAEITKQAPLDLIRAYFKVGNYEEVIVTGRELKKNYPQNKLIPDVLFETARASYKLNRTQEAENTLQTIIKEFPNFDARWKAQELNIEQIEKNNGIKAASQKLTDELSKDTPRYFDEKFRHRLVDYLIALKENVKALDQINALIKKYDNSENLPLYIKVRSDIRLKLSHYNKIISSFEEEQKYLKNSEYKISYELNYAEAYFFSKKYLLAEKTLTSIETEEINDSLNYRKDLLLSRIEEKTNKLRKAITGYKNILERYPSISDQEAILTRIGDIYYFQFEQPSTSLQYYQRVLTNSSANAVAIASYKAVLCLEKLGRIEEAIEYLYQIDTRNVDDKKLLAKIEQKRTYLMTHRFKDYQSAFEKLVTSLDNYIVSNDQDKLRADLTEIVISDLKDYDKGLQMNQSDISDKSNYNKAILYLKLADKARMEGNLSSQEKNIKFADEWKAKIKNAQDLVLEIDIEKALVVNENRVDTEMAFEFENFIRKYGAKDSSNRYRYLLADYFEKEKDPKAFQYYNELVETGIAENDFRLAKLKLAEYNFKKKQYDLANVNYKSAGNLIKISRPTEYYHRALTLAELGKETDAIKRLKFLINNSEPFNEYLDAVFYLARYYEKINNMETALEYYDRIPNSNRDDNYYRKIAELQNNLLNPEKTKLALMHIEKKTNDDMIKLAKFQFLTKDYSLAEYTYEELIKREKEDFKNRQLYYQKLGQIAFVTEDYVKAIEKYQKVIKDFGTKIEIAKYHYLDLKLIALESIIASLKIENRPQADKYSKLFKQVLKNEIAANKKIALEQGVYYIKINPGKAVNIFEKLIKKDDTPQDIKIDAYFWNGIAKLKVKDVKTAEENFKFVLQNGNQLQKNQANLKLGTINFSAEKYEDALAFYYSVIENDKEGDLAIDAARNFAFVCKTIEEWEKAINAYEIILDRFGNAKLEGETIFNIAYCHYRDKKYKHAIEMFEQALPLLKDEEMKSETQYWIGESYFGLEEFESAVTAYIKVGYNYAKYPHWHGVAEIQAGEAYLKQGKPDKAKYIWKRVISTFGAGSQWGQQAQARLDLLP
jgi:TolA-binding protein